MLKPRAMAFRTFFWLLLFVFTSLPIAWVIARSVWTPEGFTFRFYREAWTEAANYRALVNTLLISSATVLFSIALAIPSAWLVARTDLPAARFFRFMLLLPYVVPPYLNAVAWINLANPTVGWINRLLGEAVVNIYSRWGIVWVESLYAYSIVYLAVLTALEKSDPSLEEAARMSGAKPLRVLVDVTLPLLRPALLGSAFLVFSATAASFGVPYLIGKPERVTVLTTRIYEEIKGGSVDGIYAASAMGSALLALALIASFVADRLSHGRRIVTVTGKSARPSLTRLGVWRWPAATGVSLLLFLSCFLPLAALAATSFMNVSGNFAPSNFTIEKYRYVLFERPETARGFINSLILSSGAAMLAVIAGTALAYFRAHPKIKSGSAWGAVIALPYATPGTILALGMTLCWSRILPLTDTLWILLLAYFAKNFSFAVSTLSSSVKQIDVTLEEAARISGAGFVKAFTTIWLPLLRPSILAGWFLVFMPAFGELTMSVLLVGPKTETVGTVLFNLQEYADPPSASVVAMMIFMLILVTYGMAGWFSSRARSRIA